MNCLDWHHIFGRQNCNSVGISPILAEPLWGIPLGKGKLVFLEIKKIAFHIFNIIWTDWAQKIAWMFGIFIGFNRKDLWFSSQIEFVFFLLSYLCFTVTHIWRNNLISLILCLFRRHSTCFLGEIDENILYMLKYIYDNLWFMYKDNATESLSNTQVPWHVFAIWGNWFPLGNTALTSRFFLTSQLWLQYGDSIREKRTIVDLGFSLCKFYGSIQRSNVYMDSFVYVVTKFSQ